MKAVCCWGLRRVTSFMFMVPVVSVSLPGYFLCGSSLSTLLVIAALYYIACIYCACQLTKTPCIFRQTPSDFLFYMQSISMEWLLTLRLNLIHAGCRYFGYLICDYQHVAPIGRKELAWTPPVCVNPDVSQAGSESVPQSFLWCKYPV